MRRNASAPTLAVYSYVSRKYTPPDLKDVETEDTENARQLQALRCATQGDV